MSSDVGDALQRVLHIIGGQDLLHRTVYVQPVGVVAGVGLVSHGVHLALDHKLVVVQIAVVGGDPEVFAHILAAQAFLTGHQRLEQLFAVAGADDVGAGVAEQLLHGLGQIANGGGVRLLDEQVAGMSVLEREHDKADRLIQIHQEAGHVGVGDGDGIAGFDLVDKQGNDAAAAAHDVAVAGAADGGAAALRSHAGVGVDDVLHHGLGDAHGVDGVGRLVGGQADHALDAGVDGGVQDIVRADDVGLHGLHGEKLAGGNLLQRRGVEYVVDTGHGIPDGLGIADVTDVELHLFGVLRVAGLQLVAHIVLLLLVAGEDADLLQIRIQKMLQNGRTKRTSTTSDHKGCVIKCGHEWPPLLVAKNPGRKILALNSISLA